MPPKKKPKLAEASELENGQVSSNTPASGESAKQDTDYDLVADPWTDEQETALLKAIIKWKPVGMHKHFRMIAISEFMKSQGYAPSHSDHTRIPGIWKKLSTLYNLPALDEREDSLVTDMADDADFSNERYCPFELPEEEYGDMMFERRLATEASESPVASGRVESRGGSTAAETDEARSSPAPSRGRKSNRGGRQGTRGTRSKRAQAETEESRKGTATGEEDGDSEDSDENDDEEASDAAKDDSDIDDDAEEETGDSPATRNTRAQTTRSKRGGGTGRRGRRR